MYYLQIKYDIDISVCVIPTYAILYLGNGKQLEIIETAMFIVVLDESRPKNDSEVSWSLMVGKPQNR